MKKRILFALLAAPLLAALSFVSSTPAHAGDGDGIPEAWQWICMLHPDSCPFPRTAPTTLDRHGCPNQLDRFMDQKEYTVDQPNGQVTNPANTNVGFIWGPNLVINGQNYGRKAVVNQTQTLGRKGLQTCAIYVPADHHQNLKTAG